MECGRGIWHARATLMFLCDPQLEPSSPRLGLDDANQICVHLGGCHAVVAW